MTKQIKISVLKNQYGKLIGYWSFLKQLSFVISEIRSIDNYIDMQIEAKYIKSSINYLKYLINEIVY